VQKGPSRLWALGRDLVDQDPVNAFQVEVKEQKFQEADVQEGIMEVERRL